MLIGTCGLGLVVARNLVERSQETALLEAVGFRLGKIRKLSFFEHAKMACWGILIGSISAVLELRQHCLVQSGINLKRVLFGFF